MIVRPTMGNLIYVGLFCCFLLVDLGVCLSLKDEDVSDSLLRVLMRKIHEQDEKIAAIEENAKLDYRHLVSKILRLEDKLKDSNFKQLILEKTVRNMDKTIKELNSKLRTKKEDYLNNEHSLGKQENPYSEPPATVFQNTTDVEDRSVVANSKQKRILNGGVHPSKLSASFPIVKLCNILYYKTGCIILLYQIRHLLYYGFLILQQMSSHSMLISVNQKIRLVCTTP